MIAHKVHTSYFLVVERSLPNSSQTEEYKEWKQWTDADLIQRFETGDLDFSIFITKSSEHARNVEKLYNAYKTLQPELHAPTREIIRRAAYEVHFQSCTTPLKSIHWPRDRDEAGNNNDVTLASETAPAKLLDRVDSHTTLGPGGFMSRKLVPNEEIVSNMRLQLLETRDWNVASWLQATPELAIEASLLRGLDNFGAFS
jgi:hypothetical protein